MCAYPSWWFASFVAALLVVVVVALYLYQMKQVRRQFQIRLDERVAERNRIAREFHDSLLQGFQGLMFRLQAVRRMLPTRPDEALKGLDMALGLGDEAIAEGREAVQVLRSPAQEGGDLVEMLTTLGEELVCLVAGEAPRFGVLLEGKPVTLDPFVRDSVYRIAREALRNAFKHSQARAIEADVCFLDAELLLRVRDDGMGLDAKVLAEGRRAGHWGLPGMRERAAAVDGSVEVWSDCGAGTEIELTIPARVAYGRSGVRKPLWFLQQNRRPERATP